MEIYTLFYMATMHLWPTESQRFTGNAVAQTW